MKISTLALLLLLLSSMASGVGAQASPDSLPRVVEHAEPIYPPLARQTRISGNVRLNLTTDGESVVSAEVIAGHPLLVASAQQNVRTWKFAPHKPGTFLVTFEFKLASGAVDVEFLESPSIIRLEAPAPLVSAYYASIDLGTWDAHMTAPFGKLRRTLKLSYTGDRGQWLDGEFLDKKAVPKNDDDSDDTDNSESIDYGHKEGDFIAFSIKIRISNSRQILTLFVGKINGIKITGTFVTESGATGKWTATRLPETPASHQRICSLE